MNIKIPLFILLFAFSLPLTVSAQKREVLITIGDMKITRDEFERIYRKNNQNLLDESDTKSPEEYLGLYIDFKLKVLEAMNLKMDTFRTFREELAGYRKELAAPFLTDMQYDEALIKELYLRTTREINASHILLLVNENSGPDQEKAALEKAERIREEILAGKDFSTAVVEYSEEPSAQTQKGNLGYFSAFQMVTPFENAAFNTPTGEISDPVRTSFGYHLIKVHDVRDHPGEIKVAHIMKMFPGDEDLFDRAHMKNEIDSIYAELRNGADFAEMAREHSEDVRSAVEGGEMPWFSPGQMIPEFAEPAFRLKNIGDISEPIETPFGYHIIKKTGYRPPPTFEQRKTEIENRIKQDPHRSTGTKKAFIQNLKKAYGFVENYENYEKIKLQNINTETKENPLLFTIDQKNFFLDAFQKHLQKMNVTNGTFSDYYEMWVAAEITALEDARLEEKYPEFRYIMQEYHDGLLLFNIMEEKIWNFSVTDTAGLENFFQKNKELFKWGERFDGIIFTCADTATYNAAKKYLDTKKTPYEVAELLNNDGLKIELNENIWEKGSNSVIDHLVWNGSAPAGFNPLLTFIKGEKTPPQPKTLDEARGLYISEYQNFLEKEWLNTLREKYRVKVNKKLLRSIKNE